MISSVIQFANNDSTYKIDITFFRKRIFALALIYNNKKLVLKEWSYNLYKCRRNGSLTHDCVLFNGVSTYCYIL